jgi:hypothetical protein
MANNIAFSPRGQTVLLTIGTTSAQVAVNADAPCNQVHVHNDSSQEVFLRFSSVTGQAAAVPVDGTPAYGMALHGQTTEVYTVPQASISAQATLYVSGIASGGSNHLVYITPGEGLK